MIREGHSYLDYTRGDEGYKKSFTNEQFMNYSIKVYSNWLLFIIAKIYLYMKNTSWGQKAVNNKTLRMFKKLIS